MKTFVVFQEHPFGEGKIIANVDISSGGDIVEFQCIGEVLWVGKPGAHFPDEARRICYPNITLYQANTTFLRGAVLVSPGCGSRKRLHFVSVDIFYCDNDVTLAAFAK